MEVIKNVTNMQNTQISKASETVAPKDKGTKVAVEKTVTEIVKQNSEVSKSQLGKVDTQEQMEQLVEQLNQALDPFRTSLRFGFDNSSEDFYVSVIETQNNKVIRRFPAEDAMKILPRIQELQGFLFDEKG